VREGKKTFLVFGASGSIGSAIAHRFEEEGWWVVRTSRDAGNAPGQSGTWVSINPFSATPIESIEALTRFAPYSAVCWAQGKNLNDSVYTVNAAANLDLYQANCLYIVVTLKALLDRKLLSPRARLCIISSIWQNLARQNKLSYCMTKAALQGLVLSAAADLGVDGYLINAILPGALDTPMTRQNLAPEQIERFSSATLFHRLPALEDVVSLAYFLCSEQNTGITGQFIAADLGFSHVRIL
jgi:hypothetical protein